MPEPATKNPINSKTVNVNVGLLAVHTIARWINPDFEIPQDVLVAFFTLLNVILRFITKSALGGK